MKSPASGAWHPVTNFTTGGIYWRRRTRATVFASLHLPATVVGSGRPSAGWHDERPRPRDCSFKNAGPFSPAGSDRPEPRPMAPRYVRDQGYTGSSVRRPRQNTLGGILYHRRLASPTIAVAA